MRCHPLMSRPLAVAVFGLALSACNGSTGLGGLSGIPPAQPSHVRHHSSSNPIQHVIIVIQENRSFNNLFYGVKGAKYAKYGYNSNNQKITLQPVTLATTWDLEHDSYGFITSCNGTGSTPGTNCRMNGFNNEWTGCYASRCPYQYPMYAYVPHSEIGPYLSMAKQYVLADQMYASNFDESSFISHQYFISGQAEHAVNYPGGDWGCPGGSGDIVDEVGPDRQVPYGYEVVCWDPTTLGDELDNAGVSWAFYTATVNGDLGIWSAYQAINHIYNGPDWKKDVLTPQTTFFSDVKYGKLRAVNWITPTWENSDHAGSGDKTGPMWVASIVNAIGHSQYWENTAIFIFWDDPGGWYDPEAPKYVDYDGLGLRIPMLVVSAYAKKGYVSHVPYEHGSVLKFVEDIWGLPRMTASDTRANSPAADCFDFSAPPRRFKSIPSALGIDYFLDQPTSGRPPDTN
jgi:phospholipase C